MSDSPPSSQILLMVPKRDELRALGAICDFDPNTPDCTVGTELEAWRVRVGELSVGVVLADGQGSAKLALATRAALDELDPAVAFCIGTAAGRQGRTNYLDVVLATAVLDASEWRAEADGLLPQWTEQPRPPREALHDIDGFVKRDDWHDESRMWLGAATTALGRPLDGEVRVELA